MGSERRRLPVAAKMALPMAGAMPTIGVSPAPGRGHVLSIDQDHFDRRSIAEPRNTVLREVRVQDAPILELNGLKQRASDSHIIRALDLIAQLVWIHHRAAIKSRDDSDHAHLPRRGIDRHLRASRHVAALIEPSRDAVAMTGLRFGLTPAEFLRRRLQRVPEARIREVFEAEIQRVHLGQMSRARP